MLCSQDLQTFKLTDFGAACEIPCDDEELDEVQHFGLIRLVYKKVV